VVFLQERTSADERLARIASVQQGVFTRAQAEACGLSDAIISWRQRTRRWVRLYPRVYAYAGAPTTWQREAIAACLYFGDGAAVSFRAAAAFRNFPGFKRSRIDITVPRARNRSRVYTLKVHSSTFGLPVEDITVTDGIPVTKPARTLMDLATVEPEDVIERCLDDALRRKLISLAFLDRWLDHPRRSKHRGARVLRRLVDARAGAGATDSPLETRTLRLIRSARLPLPMLQYVVRDDDGPVARVDFAYPRERVAIEVDGFRYHDGRATFDHERTRGNEIVTLGWKLLRVTATHLDDHPSEVVEWIRRALTDPS